MYRYLTRLITIITFLTIPTLSTAQSRNIDIGNNAGVPSDSFAGAGVPGPWEVMIPGSGHVDFPETEGDLERLLDDFIWLDDVSAYITFVKLENGTYRLIAYAWGGSQGSSTCVWTALDYSDMQCIGGPWPGQLQLGITHTQHLVEVTEGTMRVSFWGSFEGGSSLNGFQIIKYEDIPGACCNRFNGACIEKVLQNECTGAKYVWHIDATCDEISCNPILGACCDRFNGFCQDGLLQEDCTGNVVFARGEKCNDLDPACTPIFGACCNTRFGTCTYTILTQCSGTNLNWTKGENCSARNCPDPFIPAVSEWGLVMLTLLLLIGAKIYFNQPGKNKFTNRCGA